MQDFNVYKLTLLIMMLLILIIYESRIYIYQLRNEKFFSLRESSKARTLNSSMISAKIVHFSAGVNVSFF